RQLARAENFQTFVQLFDHSLRQQVVGSEGIAFQLLDPAQIEDGVLLLKDIRKTALGQAAMQRHLAAFKSALLAESSAGPLSLAAAGGGLAVARAHAAPDALAHVLLPGGRS